MKVSALSCPQCGGSQDVSEDQNVVDCRYCRTVLRVERSAAGELERLLMESREANGELLAENRRLELTNEIQDLDAKWAELQKKLKAAGGDLPGPSSELIGWLWILVSALPMWVGIQYGFGGAWLKGLALVG